MNTGFLRGRYRLLVYFAVVYVSLVFWWRHCWFSPDSTNYLTAAINLIEHGQMFVLTNWPSFSLDPAPELYKLQPFGFPLYLAFFVAIFQDPFFSAVIAQSVAIGIFFLGLWQCTALGGWKPITWASFLILFLSFSPFGNVFSFLWTEPLFMGLTLLLLASIARYYRVSRRKEEFVFSIILLFAICSLRFTGVFSLGFFLPALFRKELRLRSFVGLVGVSLLPSVIWHFRNRLISGQNFETHYGWGISWETVQQKAWNIFESLRLVLAYGNTLVFLILLGFVSFLIWKDFRTYRQKQESSWNTLSTIALAGLAVHFFGLSALALVSEIGNLIRPELEQARLLVTVYLLFFIWSHGVLNTLIPRQRMVGLLLMIAMVGNYPQFSFRSRLHVVPFINQPPERQLWKEIGKLDSASRAKFFYSDYDFTHQIFSKKIQRILWDDSEGFGPEPISREKIMKLLMRDGNPFFLLKSQSKGLIASLDSQAGFFGLKALDFPGLGFRLYYRETQ